MQHSSCSCRRTGRTRGFHKNKDRPKYVSLQNAVMSRIIDNRKAKMQQKNKPLSTHIEQIVPSEQVEKNTEENSPVAINKKAEAEIPAAIINQVKKIKEALVPSGDIQTEKRLSFRPLHLKIKSKKRWAVCICRGSSLSCRGYSFTCRRTSHTCKRFFLSCRRIKNKSNWT